MIAQEKIAYIENNGFVFFREFVDAAKVTQAHDELLEWFEKDLEERRKNNISDPHYDGCAGHTILTEPSHLMIDVYGKSPTLDQIVEKVFTDPVSSQVLKELVGDDIDFYGYNLRLMTGSYDPEPAHEWHRDSPGEMGIGILLTDIEPDSNAATAFVPGSHQFPYCPRWNTLFKGSCRDYKTLKGIAKILMNLLPFNKILERKVKKIATGASGKRGDIYYFINDVWHGRQSNLNNKKSMVLLIGGSPTDIKLPHAVKMPPAHFLENLPPHVKNAYCNREKPINSNQNTILHRMIKNRKKLKKLSLFYFAQLERKIYDIVIEGLKASPKLFTFFKKYLKKGFTDRKNVLK